MGWLVPGVWGGGSCLVRYPLLLLVSLGSSFSRASVLSALAASLGLGLPLIEKMPLLSFSFVVLALALALLYCGPIT